jgi:hypothetical protein
MMAIALVELMQTDSTLPCFAALGAGTAGALKQRFEPGLLDAAVPAHCERLIDGSVGSNWTRLYDSVRPFFFSLLILHDGANIMGLQFQYYSQSIL